MDFFDGHRWDNAPQNLGSFASEAFPPDLDPAFLKEVWKYLIETLVMAYAGTLIGAAIALPLAVLATRHLTGYGVALPIRFVLAVVRTIPSLVWALIAIILVGLGPLPGVIGLAAYTVGYLGKLYYESFEAVDPEVLEAVRSTGAGPLLLARHAVLPESMNSVLSQLFFIFEYNVRASSILGIVGAGGIGFLLSEAFNNFRYDRLATILLALLVVVLALEAVSWLLRRRHLLSSQAGTAG